MPQGILPAQTSDRADPDVGRRPQPSLPARCLRALRRGWRHLRIVLRPPRCSFVYHLGYEGRMPGVPFDPQRGEKVLTFLDQEGLLGRSLLLPGRPASLREILRVHTTTYLDALQDTALLTRILGVEVTDREAERTLQLQRLMTGGTIRACKTAQRTGGVAVNLGGGFHHALPDEGMGFCVFNDVAIAIAALRSRGYGKPILVVDLDVHDGNGTRTIFAEDPTVHTFSIHAESWGDEQAVASTTVALGPDIEDRQLMDTLRSTLPRVVASFQPELVLYVAGSDVAADDELGNWRLSPGGILARDRFVAEQFRRADRRIPMAVTLSGGYGSGAWRYPGRFLAWLVSGTVLEPPGDEELALARFRRIGSSLRPSELSGDPEGFSFQLDESDLVGIDPSLPQDPRFLGFFSRHGIELVLERFGILDRLREKGFDDLRIELDTTGTTGQTLRVFSDVPSEELLVEVRVLRSRGAVPELEVLIVEWLLLQNPRASFGPKRPPLPGQQHPGLGLLKGVLGALVVVCEMLKLDGIYFTPSHYHIAVQSRRIVRFLHPEHEARMRALSAALRGLPLHEATRSVNEGRVFDRGTGQPAPWEAFPMVLPVSEALKQRLFGEAYEASVEEALHELSYEVRDASSASS